MYTQRTPDLLAVALKLLVLRGLEDQADKLDNLGLAHALGQLLVLHHVVENVQGAQLQVCVRVDLRGEKRLNQKKKKKTKKNKQTKNKQNTKHTQAMTENRERERERERERDAAHQQLLEDLETLLLLADALADLWARGQQRKAARRSLARR